jgi:hypothetical protein
VITIASWEDLAGHLGGALYAAQPLEALRQSGIELDPALDAAVGAGLEQGALEPGARLAAARVAGPTPPVRISVGETPPTTPAPALSQVSGFDLTATANLTVLQALLGAWWEAQIYPQDIGPENAGRLVDAETLRAHCVGVPDDATVAALLLVTPPAVRGVGDERLMVQQGLRLRLTSSTGPAELVATARVVLPVELIVLGQRIRVDGARITGETTLSLEFDPVSVIQPRSATARAALERAIATRLGSALGLIAQLDWWLSATYQLPGVLSHSHVIVEAASAWLLEDRAVLGALVAPEQSGDPRPPPPREPLADQGAPATLPDDVRAVLSEQAIENLLRAGLDRATSPPPSTTASPRCWARRPRPRSSTTCT